MKIKFKGFYLANQQIKNEVALSRSAYSLRPFALLSPATLRTGAPAPDLRPQGYAPNPKKVKKEKLILRHLEAIFNITRHGSITIDLKQS